MTHTLEALLGQSLSLPEVNRNVLSKEFPDEELLVYASTDLDEDLALRLAWVAVLEKHFVYFKADGSHHALALDDFERMELSEGLSLSLLTLIKTDGQIFDQLRYSRRQARAMSTVQFSTEQQAKALKADKEASGGAKPELQDAVKLGGGSTEADKEYRDSMSKGLDESISLTDQKKSGILWRLFMQLAPYKKSVLIASLAALAMTVVSLFPPILSRILIDDILSPLEKDPSTVAWGLLGSVIAGLAGILVCQELLQLIRLRFMAVTGEKVAAKLRQDIYSHLQTLNLQYFNSRPTGSLIARVSSDTDRMWDFITFGFLDAFISILQIIGVAIALIAQNPALSLVVIIPVPLMAFLFWLHGQRMSRNFHRIWQRWSALTSILSDVIPGMRVVKAFAQEDYEKDRFAKKNISVQDEAVRLHKEWTLFWPAVVMFIHISNVLIWVLGVPQVIANYQTGGSEGMGLGVFVAFTGYLWMFWNPVQQLGQLSRTINRVITSAARVFEVMDTKPTIFSKPDAVKPDHFTGTVEFKDVSFTYDGIRNVLKGVSFKVEPGEMIGLVGPSGGGKTTMVNLICRFYDPREGSIKIDGTDVRDLDLQSLRRHIGVVLQEPYLFHGTIAENIAYGSEQASVEEIMEAARAANAHDFICGLPDGYETMVGERGQTLSGGERQRISIARAILHKPSILILDEATSSVVTETERHIQEALSRLTAGRTTFAIAHRLSTLSAANRLFVMENGKLVEHGSHQELLAKPEGVYAKLHKTQLEMQATIAV